MAAVWCELRQRCRAVHRPRSTPCEAAGWEGCVAAVWCELRQRCRAVHRPRSMPCEAAAAWLLLFGCRAA